MKNNKNTNRLFLYDIFLSPNVANKITKYIAIVNTYSTETTQPYFLPVGGIIHQMLTVCCISADFIYSFNLFLANLQEVSFYCVKGRLSKGERPCLAG